MKRTPCFAADGAEIKDLAVIELNLYGDNRGFFVERFNEKYFSDIGLPTHFVQDNHSRSAPGVLRGMHFQYDKPQGKLVGAIRGRIWDAVVDVRAQSPTYGKSFGLELSDMNGKLLWVPPGFAHGFCVLGSEPADVIYKVTALYNPSGEEGIMWNDPDFNVAWPLRDMAHAPIVSVRDQKQGSFADYKKTPRF